MKFKKKAYFRVTLIESIQGKFPIDVAPRHDCSSHLTAGDYVNSLVVVESKIPA